MLADTQPSTVGGLNNEFIYSGRLDNQMSAYCAIQVEEFRGRERENQRHLFVSKGFGQFIGFITK